MVHASWEKKKGLRRFWLKKGGRPGGKSTSRTDKGRGGSSEFVAGGGRRGIPLLLPMGKRKKGDRGEIGKKSSGKKRRKFELLERKITKGGKKKVGCRV